MKPKRPNNRASTEVQVLLAAAGVIVAIVATVAVKQFFYGFYTDPAASSEQVSNVANGISSVVIAAPGLAVVAVLVVILIEGTLE